MAETAITIKEYLAAPNVMRRVEEMLDKRASQFTTSVLALAGSDPKIMACEPRSLFNACLTAAALDLPINKNLGFAHIIPYKNNQQNITEAQFQMGWKGFVQLAQRSGQYRTISATAVLEGQLVDENPLTGNTYDWKAATSEVVIGYVGFFRLINGFEHELFMSRKEMGVHALRYSQAYKADQKYNSTKSPWSTDFDSMGLKTVIKLNVAKFGPMSIEMQEALLSDQAIIRDDNKREYIDGTDLLDEEKATDEKKQAILEANADFSGELAEGKTDMAKAAQEILGGEEVPFESEGDVKKTTEAKGDSTAPSRTGKR